MSVQMRLVHTRMGMTPPALHSEESAREMALHAPQPSPMPARMRARFTATTDGGVTRVLPKRGLRSGGVLVFLHGGAYVYPLVEGSGASSKASSTAQACPSLFLTTRSPPNMRRPTHSTSSSPSLTRPRLSSAESSSSATPPGAAWLFLWRCSDGTRERVRWTASSCMRRGWTSR